MTSVTSQQLVLLSIGAFNPPTPIHFRIFELAKDHFEHIDKTRVLAGIIVPIISDSYQKSRLISIEHRSCMINLALKSSTWIRLSKQGFKYEKKFSIRSCLEHHQNFINNIINGSGNFQNSDVPEWYPENLHFQGKVQVKLLGGIDLLENFKTTDTWKLLEFEDILRHHGLVIVTKSEVFCEKIVFDSDLLTKYKKNITFITNWASSEISSSLVRRLIGRKQSVKYLLDDPVIDYISKNNLYSNNSSNNSEKKNDTVVISDVEEMDVTDFPSCERKDVDRETINNEEHLDETNFTNFLKLAIENNRLKVVRKEHFFV